MRHTPPRHWLRPGRILAFTAVAATLALAQDDPAPADAAAGGMQAFGQMIPEGVVNQGVSVPSFKNGRPASLLTAGTVTRLDADRLAAQDIKVEIYGDRPEETLYVDLHSAVYHMEDQILRSGERSRVSRNDFEMEGDSLVYDSANSVGAMKGRVRTLIFDMDEVSGKTEDNQPSR